VARSRSGVSSSSSASASASSSSLRQETAEGVRHRLGQTEKDEEEAAAAAAVAREEGLAKEEGCGQCSASCTVCRMPCRGLFAVCTGCGHGGHPEHIRAWFSATPMTSAAAAGAAGSSSSSSSSSSGGCGSRKSKRGGVDQSSNASASGRSAQTTNQAGRVLFGGARALCPSGCGCRCAQVMAEAWGLSAEDKRPAEE
jgi:hypothetical protein